MQPMLAQRTPIMKQMISLRWIYDVIGSIGPLADPGRGAPITVS
jgi:hypothetical protein